MNNFDLSVFNLNLLVALRALLEERSVTRAARRAGVSQSAMSHSLAKLRAQLDDPLLVSQGRALALTPRAEAIGAALGPALEALREALAPSETFDPARATRELSIATYDSFELALLPRLLAVLREHAPGVRLRVERLDARARSRLARGELDLCVSGEEDLATGLTRTKLFDDPFLVIARRGHPGIGRRLTLARYAALGHVLVSVEGREQGVVDRALQKRGKRREVVVRVPHFMGAPPAVAGSDLVCTLPATVARAATPLFDLTVHRAPLPLPPVPVTAYWPARFDRDPAHRYLRARLAEVARGAARSRRARGAER